MTQNLKLREEIKPIFERFYVNAIKDLSCEEVNNLINNSMLAILALIDKDRKELVEKADIEFICEKVHQAYCKYHLENKGFEYWTKGDYSKLTDEGKEYDRRTVRAVLQALATASILK